MSSAMTWVSLAYLVVLVGAVLLFKRYGHSWIDSVMAGLAVSFFVGLLLAALFLSAQWRTYLNWAQQSRNATTLGQPAPALPDRGNFLTWLATFLLTLTPLLVLGYVAIKGIAQSVKYAKVPERVGYAARSVRSPLPARDININV